MGPGWLPARRVTSPAFTSGPNPTPKHDALKRGCLNGRQRPCPLVGERGLFAPALLVVRPALTGIRPPTLDLIFGAQLVRVNPTPSISCASAPLEVVFSAEPQERDVERLNLRVVLRTFRKDVLGEASHQRRVEFDWLRRVVL